MKRRLYTVVLLVVSACGPARHGERESGAERLNQKLVAVAAPRHLSQVAEVDTVNSRVVPGLTYYVGQAMRTGYHDYVQASVGVRDGVWFDPDSLSEWAPVLGSWSPETPDAAKQFCKELVANGPAEAPQRLVRNTLLELRDVERFLEGPNREAVQRLLEPGVIPAPADSAGWWLVDLWYPHGFGLEGGARIATKYRCTLPGSEASGHAPRVETVDSLLYPEVAAARQ